VTDQTTITHPQVRVYSVDDGPERTFRLELFPDSDHAVSDVITKDSAKKLADFLRDAIINAPEEAEAWSAALASVDAAEAEAANAPTGPCPDWCGLPAGHAYRDGGPGGAMWRTHSLTVADGLELEAHEDWSAAGPQLEAPHAYMDTKEVELTADELDQRADEFRAAAFQLRLIEAGS
jgi:hypothetical protein